ncbi:MAG: hypothetical protein GY810_21150 [Aureispira sp.]|nr:hypothetical protein [Aureispira sp.]
MAPSSYLKVVYQAPVPIVLIQEDGNKVYVKFKLLAKNLQKEEGLLDQDHQRKLLKTTAIQDTSKKKDFYLKEEYQDAIEADRANYTLQMQVWDPSKTPDQDFWKMLNPAIPWDATKYEWEDVGNLSIKEQLSAQASDNIRFNVANHPDFIDLPKPISIYDPMGINWIRKMTYQILQAAKLETIYTSKLNPDKNNPKVLCLEFGEIPTQDFALAIEFIGEQMQSSILQISNVQKGGIQFGQQILFKVAYETISNLKMVRLHLSDKMAPPVKVLKIMEPGRIHSFINHKEEDSGSFILFNSKGSLP